MVIPVLEVQGQVRPEETSHLLLYSVGQYFPHADRAGFSETPALSSGVAGDENENEAT